jgi:hypothetical protein
MPQHPFPDPGPDHEEPDRSPLPPAAEGDGPAEQGPGLFDGLSGDGGRLVSGE